ncbi:hypothetical protein INR49_019937 [Caranx melampygus]|nr:hypothetical protein INR49_019937 [Caranx melampygus]
MKEIDAAAHKPTGIHYSPEEMTSSQRNSGLHSTVRSTTDVDNALDTPHFLRGELWLPGRGTAVPWSPEEFDSYLWRGHISDL